MIAIFVVGIFLPLHWSVMIAVFISIWIYLWSGLLAGETILAVILNRLVFVYSVLAMAAGISLTYDNLREEQRKQDKKYQIIFNASRNALVITDGNSILECNDMCVHTFEYNRHTVPHLAQTMFSEAWPVLQSLLNERNSENNEVTLKRAGGELFSAIVNISLLTEFGQPMYLLSIRDITERQQAARLQLEQEQRRVTILEEFISNASHDLKNPLTTIGTSLYLLRRRLDIPEDNRHLRVAEQEVNHLTNLFDDLLALPRMEGENFALRLEPTVLYDLVHAEVDSHQSMARQRSHQLIFDPPVMPLADMMIDRKEMRRALRQLLTNAIKYTPPEGHIRVSLYPETAHYVIAVEDNGPGIPVEVRELIFERFYRVGGTASKVTDGLGVGLSIVKRVVEAHEGRVEVNSTPGTGSIFRICLPV
ncbi:MAG: ATP-binding protein [Chloroflexota bacterium]